MRLAHCEHWDRHAGIVEVQPVPGGVWKRVCDSDEGWTKSDAIVTCRQLGYPSPELAHSNGSFTQGWGRGSATDNIPDCHGNEPRLSDCPALNVPHDCFWNAALVDCGDCTVIPPTTSTTAVAHAIECTTSRKTLPRTITTFSPSPQPISSVTPSRVGSIAMTTDEVSMATPMQSDTANTGADSTKTFHSLNTLTVRIIGGVTVAIVSTALISCLLIIVCTARRRSQRSRKVKRIEMTRNEAYVEVKKVTIFLQVNDHGSIPEPVYEFIE